MSSVIIAQKPKSFVLVKRQRRNNMKKAKTISQEKETRRHVEALIKIALSDKKTPAKKLIKIAMRGLRWKVVP